MPGHAVEHGLPRAPPAMLDKAVVRGRGFQHLGSPSQSGATAASALPIGPSRKNRSHRLDLGELGVQELDRRHAPVCPPAKTLAMPPTQGRSPPPRADPRADALLLPAPLQSPVERCYHRRLSAGPRLAGAPPRAELHAKETPSMPAMRSLPPIHRPLEDALALGPRCSRAPALAEGRRGSPPASSRARRGAERGPARGARCRSFGLRRAAAKVLRRATTGTAAFLGGRGVVWTLALPHAAALAPDATARTLLNRNVRGFLKGLLPRRRARALLRARVDLCSTAPPRCSVSTPRRTARSSSRSSRVSTRRSRSPRARGAGRARRRPLAGQGPGPRSPTSFRRGLARGARARRRRGSPSAPRSR